MPRTSCCVPGCSKRGGYHFPSYTELKKQWLSAIQRDNWIPKESSAVCKAHFTIQDFVTEDGLPTDKLKKSSVPSVFWWSSSPDKSTKNSSSMRKNLPTMKKMAGGKRKSSTGLATKHKLVPRRVPFAIGIEDEEDLEQYEDEDQHNEDVIDGGDQEEEEEDEEELEDEELDGEEEDEIDEDEFQDAGAIETSDEEYRGDDDDDEDDDIDEDEIKKVVSISSGRVVASFGSSGGGGGVGNNIKQHRRVLSISNNDITPPPPPSSRAKQTAGTARTASNPKKRKVADNEDDVLLSDSKRSRMDSITEYSRQLSKAYKEISRLSTRCQVLDAALKNKSLVGHRARTVYQIGKYVLPHQLSFIESQAVNSTLSPNARRWSRRMRNISLGLHRHSRHAYNFMAKIFALPTEAELHKWGAQSQTAINEGDVASNNVSLVEAEALIDEATFDNLMSVVL